jgi:hypothetical protein
MRSDRIAIAAVAAAACLLAAQLLVKPIVGLANNGDFINAMGPAGLAYVDDDTSRFFRWTLTTFAFTEPVTDPERYGTTEALLAGARLFDIRVMGGLHAALLLLGFGLCVAATRGLAPAARWTAAILFVLVFTDVAYAAPLNSLYGQAAALVFLLLTAGIAALAIRRGGLAGPWVPAYFVAAGLFACSKPHEPLHAPLLAALGVVLAWGGRRGRAAAIGLAVVLLAAAHVYFRSTPQFLRRSCQFQAFFDEMLPNSPDPAADLRRVGLPASYVRYSGANAFDGNSPLKDPAFREELDTTLGYRALARIYLSEPGRAFWVVRRAAWEGARMRQPSFGDLPKETGAPERAQSRRFALWSGLKLLLQPTTLAIWSALLIGSVVAAAATLRQASPRGRMARVGLLVLCVMAVLEFAVCAFADSHVELVRHLYVFHAMIDLILVADATWVAQLVSERAARARAH